MAPAHWTLLLGSCSLPSPGVRKQQAPSGINSLRPETRLNRAEVVEGTSLGSQTAAADKPIAEGKPHSLLRKSLQWQSCYLAEDPTSRTAAQQRVSTVRGRAEAASSLHLKGLTFNKVGSAVSCGAGPAMGLCFTFPHIGFDELGSKPLSKADTHMPHPGTAANIRQETSRHLNIEQPGLARGKSSAGASRLPWSASSYAQYCTEWNNTGNPFIWKNKYSHKLTYGMLVFCWDVLVLQGENKIPSTAQDFQNPPKISGESKFRCQVCHINVTVSPRELNADSLETRPCYACQDGHAMVIGRSYSG